VILAREVHDPRIGFATITTVRVSPDLRHARVFVSVLGSEAEKREALAALNRAASFVRRLIGARIRLRHTPDINFVLDNSVEYGAKMSQILDKVKHEDELHATAAEENPAGDGEADHQPGGEEK